MIFRQNPRPMLGLASLGLVSLGWASLALVPVASAQPSQGAPPPGMYEQERGPPSVGPHQQPLYAVAGIEVTQAGALTMVKVRGLASTAGWQDPALVPLVRNVPSDGVLDLVLVAEPPPETMNATGFAPVDAVLLIEQNHPYRGVRVRSATNVLSVAKLPGKAAAAAGGEDCRACVGRTLSGAGTDTVARDALPKGTRVLGPADPIPDMVPNPNRLTLLVGDDGRVIEAVWQ